MLAAVSLLFIGQPVEAAAGFQPFAEGAAEIQFARVAPGAALGGEFTVELLGNGMDHVDGLGDILILKLGDVTV